MSTRYHIAADPAFTQRELALRLGVSLDKVSKLCNSTNKLAFAYLLTPSGVEEMARVSVRCMTRGRGE